MNTNKRHSAIVILSMASIFIFVCSSRMQASDYYQWPQYSPTVAYDYQEEYGTLAPPTMVMDDVWNDNGDPVGTYADRWWCFRWGSDMNPAVTEAAWIAMVDRFNTDFDYITNIMRWPRDKRARNGYYSTIYLYGSGLSTDNASNTEGGGWQGTTNWNGNWWPMVLASYIPVSAFDPSGGDSYQTGAMIHEGIHCILSSMPGCKNSCWFQEGGNTWLQGTMEAQRSGNYSGLGWLSAGSAIAPFMPIECYTGWLQDGSFGGPCAEGVNMFDGSQQICTWRRLLGGTQYGECFPHAMEVILGPKSVAWVWRNCSRSGRVLQDLAEAPGGLGDAQTRRLIQEYRGRQAFCDFGPWSYAFRQLLNNNWATAIGPEWEPKWIDCPVWNATCYVDTLQTGNLMEPEEQTLPGWSGANQIPLTVNPGAAEATVTFNPIGNNMSCQLAYRDTAGTIHYSEPVSSGACSIPLASVMNNIVIAVICNTDYIYYGESTRTAKYDYSLTIGAGISGKADIYTRWYNYNPASYTIAASADNHGTINPSGDITVSAGRNSTFSFLPEQGYEVDQVILNGLPIGQQNTYSFNNVRGNHTISVTFKEREPAPIKFQSETPAYDSDDVYHLSESTIDTDNVGAGDNTATYVYKGGTSLGQTFTTGTNPNGYILSDLWLKHVKYTTLTDNGTVWDINNPDSLLQVRVLDVQGTTLAELLSLNYTITSQEVGNNLMPDDPSLDKLGTGTWINFDLGDRIILDPDTQYAFDITVLLSGSRLYFETAGINTDSYSNGSAYSTAAKGDLEMGTVHTGDHTFIVDLKDITQSDMYYACYDFEDNTYDSSSSNLHATASGSPAYSKGFINNKAIDLDGYNDYIQLPNAAVNHTDITVAAWVNWDGGGSWQRIFDFGNNTTEYVFLTPSSGSNTLRFAITNSGNGSEQIIETTQMTTNEWVHIAVTLENNTGTLYVNGSVAAGNSNITVDPSNLNPQNNYIGKSQWPDPLFNGRIDDFRIYDRALSSTEIASLTAFGLNSNTPSFDSEPLIAKGAIEDYAYTDSIADNVTDPQGSSTTFSKDSGPDWLTIASDGSLSGTPHDSDTGENNFTVRVENTIGLSQTSTMIIDVANIYSGLHGIEDLAGFAGQWLTSNCTDSPACEGADLTGDTKVNITDLAELAANWLSASVN